MKVKKLHVFDTYGVKGVLDVARHLLLYDLLDVFVGESHKLLEN